MLKEYRWSQLQDTVKLEISRLYLLRSILIGSIAFAVTLSLTLVDLLPRPPAERAALIARRDWNSLAYAATAAVAAVAGLVLRARRAYSAGLPMAVVFVLVSLAHTVLLIVTGTSIEPTEIYFVIVLLVQAGLLPLTPRWFAGLTAGAVTGAIVAAHTTGHASFGPVLEAAFLTICGLTAVAIAFSNYHRWCDLISSRLAAERAIAERDEFLRILAHDLRNPIGAMPELAVLIRDKVSKSRGGPESSISAELDVLESTARGVYLLLENTLMWGQDQGDSLEVQPRRHDLGKEVRAALESEAARAHLKGITIEARVPESLVVYTDGEMVKVVVRNLVDNAVKFTQPGGRVAVSCTAIKDRIVISVEDEGIGMPDGNDGGTGNGRREGTAGERGSGVGLRVVRAVARRLGGTLDFHPREPKGTTARLSIPASVEDAQPASTPAPPRRDKAV